MCIWTSLVVQGLFFVFFIKEAVTPDENYHLSLIELHAHSWKMYPSHVPETEVHGAIEGTPYFYHLFMGKLFHLLPQGIPLRILVKMIGFLFSLGTIFFAWRTFEHVAGKGYINILALGISSHLLGYIYLTGSVSYDIFANFFASGSIFLFVVFLQQKDTKSFLLCIGFLALGSISKITILPLAGILGILMFVAGRKQIFQKQFWAPLFVKKMGYFLLLSTVVPVFLGIYLYGGNLFQYHRLLPTCEQVLSREVCQKNPFVKRDERFGKEQENIQNSYAYTPMSYGLEWASLMNQKITGIEVYQKICHTKNADSCSLAPEEYFWWREHIYPPKWFQNITIVLVVISFFCATLLGATSFFKIPLFSYMPKKIPWKSLLTLTIITIFYATTILWVNYHAYLLSGRTNTALHGRYLFPVLPILCFLGVYFFLIFLPERLQAVTTVFLFSLFFWGSLPTLLLHSESKYITTFEEGLLPDGPCNAQSPYCGPLNPDQWEYCPSERAWKCIDK